MIVAKAVNFKRCSDPVSINYVFNGVIATSRLPLRLFTLHSSLAFIQIQVLTVIYWIVIDFAIRWGEIMDAILLMDSD